MARASWSVMLLTVALAIGPLATRIGAVAGLHSKPDAMLKQPPAVPTVHPDHAKRHHKRLHFGLKPRKCGGALQQFSSRCHAQ